jgi:inner membrane protein
MNTNAIPPIIQTSRLKQYVPVMKMVGILILVLVLLIPLNMISSILEDRLKRRNEAVNEITSTWGKEQVIMGPVLVVPYRYYFKSWKEETVNGRVQRSEVTNSAIASAYFLPATLAIDGDILPNKLHRGIYEAVVFSGKLKVSGQFVPLDFETLKVDPKEIQWQDAAVFLSITDLRGTRETLHLKLDSSTVQLVPGSKLDGFPCGVYGRVAGLEKMSGNIPFDVELTFNGSSGISFAPAGVQNTVTIRSPWPDPSFNGAFLPADRQISPDGFTAKWQVSYYGRNYPQQWTDQNNGGFSSNAINASLFGVAFITPVDFYRSVERSIKYGALFIVLIFTAFFLFEILAALKVHVIQYTLVGAALCLFYLGLLSLSEFIVFGKAYLLAAGAATVMIALYSHAILKSGVRSLAIAGELAGIYGFLYVILQLQDYSLLFGTIGLFIALGAVMYATRNTDWYGKAGEGTEAQRH